MLCGWNPMNDGYTRTGFFNINTKLLYFGLPDPEVQQWSAM